MPPKWPCQPDRRDPDYRRLDDRMNFAFHVAVFAASNSSLWFFHILRPQTLLWVQWFTLTWLLLLLGHGVYVFAIASYSQTSAVDSPPKSSSG